MRRLGRHESLFCSRKCKRDFALTMCEAAACANCDAAADGALNALVSDWRDVTPDPEGFGWNYLGACPE